MANHPNRKVRYAYICPRGFDNETAYWRVSPNDQAEMQGILDSYAASPSGHAGWIKPTPAQRVMSVDWEDRQFARQCMAPYNPAA